MSWYDPHYDDADIEHEQYRSARKYGKPMGHCAPHLPNKAERKELARIMQKSGLTEEEVRQDVVHRRALAKAQKSMSKRPADRTGTRYEFEVKRARRRTAHALGVEPWDPKVDADLNEKSDIHGRSTMYRLRLRHG